MAHTTFWREWKSKLEEEKQLAEQARMLKQILPDINTSQFLSGDASYIKKVVFSYIDSVKKEKKHVLKEAVKIADTYGLQRTEVSPPSCSLSPPSFSQYSNVYRIILCYSFLGDATSLPLYFII